MRDVLVVENITKRFGGLTALSQVSFKVKEGERFGIIGPNGAGKTTLFNVINGVYRPDTGKVIFKDTDITHWPPHRRARYGMARTHQVVKPFSDLTVLENAMIGALFGPKHDSITEDEAREIASNVLEFIGLKEKADLPANVLNVQEKKRLELARALSSQPDLLLLDEVLAGLVPSEIDVMVGLLRKINEEKGITIVMIEHVMHAIMNLAERMIVLDFGRKIAEGTPSEIANNPEVIAAYLGNPELALKFVQKR
ncbi:MAG: ABC transporter ATP-binding protein [Desulfurococcales archaeon]|nr:ABC transporter ATP-binding protein [Desulfurococcales archaeon]